MLGLVASMVLRCDDCGKYHFGKSHELGVTTEQMYEILLWQILLEEQLCNSSLPQEELLNIGKINY